MFCKELTTPDEKVRLIRPDVGRDAPLSVQWLAGESGRLTLQLMGVPDADNHETTLEAERDRIGSFLGNNGELDWMIAYDGRVIGAIWVHTESTEYIAAPAVSIMIGDPDVRGKGVGYNSLVAVTKWLFEDPNTTAVYARHLVANAASKQLLQRAGFVDDGEPYVDADNLHWQNVSRANTSTE